MKILKGLLVFCTMVSVLITCGPPPEKLPEKEEVVQGMKIKGDYNKKDIDYFLEFFSAMQKAVNEKDTEKAFSFYSEDFGKDTGVNLTSLKKNLHDLNKNYKSIKYTMQNLKVYVREDNAVSDDVFLYNAVPVSRKFPALKYKGKERIYWKKEGQEWKIINWVYDE